MNPNPRYYNSKEFDIWLSLFPSCTSRTEMCKFMGKELHENAPAARGVEEARFTQSLTHKSSLLSTKSVGFCGADLGNVRLKLLIFTREQFYLWQLASCKSGTLWNRRIRNPPLSFPWSQFVFQSPSSSVVSVRGINPNRASVRASKYIHHGRGRCMLLAPLCIRFVRGGGREEPNYRLCRPWL